VTACELLQKDFGLCSPTGFLSRSHRQPSGPGARRTVVGVPRPPLRRLAFPILAAEDGARLHHACGRNLDVRREGRQKAIIAGNMVQNRGEELGIVGGGGGTNRLRAEAGQSEEAPELVGIARQVVKCLNCKLFCRLWVDSINSRHGFIFPIP